MPPVLIQARLATECTVGHRGDKVFLEVRGILTAQRGQYLMTWQAADELAADLRRRLGQEGDEGPDFLAVELARVTWLVPRSHARALQAALGAKARDAEEQAKAPAIAADQAILMRTRAPFGFSSDPRIQGEAAKAAAWDRDLRRFIRPPQSIRSAETFGRPTILKHPSKEPS